MSKTTSVIDDKNLKSEFHITEQTTVNGITHTRAAEKDYFDHKYEFGEKLGQGAFGIVQVVTDKVTLETYACKLVKKVAGSTSAYEQVMKEIELMKKISHPHILKLVEVLETPKKVYLILEYCQGGELISKIRNNKDITQEDCRIIISKLADAISFLHKQGIVHRDIKPENILISLENPNAKWDIKVSDFGLATSTNACAMMDNIVGTPLYMAPEIVKNLGYSSQCDVWSIGILMYLLLCGYTKDSETELIRMVQKGEITYPEKFWSTIPASAHHLVDMMLRIDPAKRISAKEILNHPWIKGGNVSGDFGLNTNVLDLMKSYNAERRLRKGIWVVRGAIRWRKVGRAREKAKAQSLQTAETAEIEKLQKKLGAISTAPPKQEPKKTSAVSDASKFLKQQPAAGKAAAKTETLPPAPSQSTAPKKAPATTAAPKASDTTKKPAAATSKPVTKAK